MTEELTLDSFRPLIEAEKERHRAAADFLNAQNRVRDFLRDVRARQKEEQRKFSEMLSNLKAEERTVCIQLHFPSAGERSPPLTDPSPGGC